MIALGTVSWMFFCVMRKYDRIRRSVTTKTCLVGESHNNTTFVTVVHQMSVKLDFLKHVNLDKKMFVKA